MTLDRRLLAACFEFHRYDKQIKKVETLDVSPFSDDELHGIDTRKMRLVDQIMVLPARTPAAIQAKAAVAFRCMEHVALGKEWETEEFFAMSVLKEMAQGGGA